ncbi:sugar phosphate isomerase/epimerase [Ruminococcaceae bacterium OttesenSCG-928-D13]|nr:sugar phosphate isomerase/epimerase [Ruminococcaceae bacterium OttesenSCG-928-D13]
MGNIKYSHMSHWKTIPYKTIPNFRDFYYEDKSNVAYYQDWDRILRYHCATGYEGIEIAPWDLADMLPMFGSPQGFTEFAAERGVAVSGMFHGADSAHDRSKRDEVLAAGRQAVDTIVAFGGVHMNMCPGNNYYGTGPLTREQVKDSAEVITEMGRYATDKGVMIGLHNEFFCAINKENHHEFIELTDPRFVHYCLDTAQIAIIGDDMVDFYEQYHDRICTFHLKDTASIAVPDEIRYAQDVEITDDGTRWFWEPGEGLLDFEGLWKLLKKYEFKGWMTIETDGTPDLLASMALTTYYTKHVLGKIYE